MAEHDELVTIRDIARWSVTQFNRAGLFFGHGTEDAWNEALAIIFHTLSIPHDLYAVVLDARLTLMEKTQLLALINRRIDERVPVPYLTNEAWFAGLPFYVDERVLIPRSPIAEMIENLFEPWVEADDVRDILDLCTGSGCIAIACAKQFPEAHVTASDISPDALAVAKKNVERHEVKVDLIESNLFAQLPLKQYDVIVSNPPYVDAEDMASLPKEYHHEPELGLAAGTTGLDLAITILQNAAKYLRPTGILIVEVGNSEDALSERFPDVPFTWIEFQRGGGGVFLLTAEQLQEYQFLFDAE